MYLKNNYLFVEVGSNLSADLKSYFAMFTAAAPMFKTAVQVVFDLRLVRHCPRRWYKTKQSKQEHKQTPLSGRVLFSIFLLHSAPRCCLQMLL